MIASTCCALINQGFLLTKHFPVFLAVFRLNRWITGWWVAIIRCRNYKIWVRHASVLSLFILDLQISFAGLIIFNLKTFVTLFIRTAFRYEELIKIISDRESQAPFLTPALLCAFEVTSLSTFDAPLVLVVLIFVWIPTLLILLLSVVPNLEATQLSVAYLIA